MMTPDWDHPTDSDGSFSLMLARRRTARLRSKLRGRPTDEQKSLILKEYWEYSPIWGFSGGYPDLQYLYDGDPSFHLPGLSRKTTGEMLGELRPLFNHQAESSARFERERERQRFRKIVLWGGIIVAWAAIACFTPTLTGWITATIGH